MIEYDRDILESLAAGLYSQARSIELLFSVIGLAAGGALGYGFGEEVGGLIGAGVGAIGGFMTARPIAFALRARAQSILCQVQIERNTAAGASRLAKLVQRAPELDALPEAPAAEPAAAKESPAKDPAAPSQFGSARLDELAARMPAKV